MSDDPEEEAMLLTPELVKAVAAWCGGVEVEEINPETQERYPALNVQCGDEVKRASMNDWVIRKVDRTFDVLKPNEFLRFITTPQ